MKGGALERVVTKLVSLGLEIQTFLALAVKGRKRSNIFRHGADLFPSKFSIFQKEEPNSSPKGFATNSLDYSLVHGSLNHFEIVFSQTNIWILLALACVWLHHTTHALHFILQPPSHFFIHAIKLSPSLSMMEEINMAWSHVKNQKIATLWLLFVIPLPQTQATSKRARPQGECYYKENVSVLKGKKKRGFCHL